MLQFLLLRRSFKGKASLAEEMIFEIFPLPSCKSLNAESLGDFFKELLEDVRILQSNLTRVTPMLASYDIQRAQKEINALEQLVRGYKQRLIPRKAFTFEKAREKQKKMLNHAVAEPQGQETALLEEKKEVWRENENIVLTKRDISSNNLRLSHLKECCVVLECGDLFSLKLTNLKDCKVFCGPIRGSVFVENCEDCVLELCCAQLRVHECKRCRFNLFVKSDPIIEDSEHLKVSKEYPTSKYEKEGDDLKAFNFENTENRYCNVRDFNNLLNSKNFEIMN